MPSTSRRRSSSSQPEEELRLPRAPGVIRQFWARHPLLTDILIAVVCLVVTLVPRSSTETSDAPSQAGSATDVAWAPAALVVVLAAASVILVWRRRHPTMAFVASLVASATFLLGDPPGGSPLLLVTAYSLAVYRSSRACWTGLGIGIGALALLALALIGAGSISVQTALNAVIGEVIIGLIGALIGINVGNRRRYLEAVIDRSRQLLVERDQQAQLAAADERARIAREMHDIVSHSLTVVVALSEGAAATADHDRARSAMDAAATTARGALMEMRAMLGVLRDGAPDAVLAPMEPVAPEVTVAAAQRAGVPATLIVSGTPALPDQVRFAVGRIVQEGVTNAMRHAPGATAVVVRIDYSDDTVIVTVRNDGVRDGVDGGGFGIPGLRERAAHVGGTVTSAQGADGWWQLRAVLPAVSSDAATPTPPSPTPTATSAKEAWA